MLGGCPRRNRPGVLSSEASQGSEELALPADWKGETGSHRTIMSAVTQTPGESIAVVCLTPPQPLALLGPAALRCSSLARFRLAASQEVGTLDSARRVG